VGIGSNSIASRSAPLSASSRSARLGLIALILGAVVVAFASAAGLLRPDALTPSKMIDAFERVNGEHAGFRRNHAKGVGIRGYFESNGKGAALSKASVFRVGRYPVIGRFAIAGGKPAGTDAPSSVRSMALLIQLPNGEEWRTGMNDIPVFGVSTPQAFYEQLLASAPDPKTGKPDPAKVSAFLSKFPSAAKASQLIRSEPKAPSFDTDTFNSLNSFRFTNDAGAVQPVRWSMVPSKVPSLPRTLERHPVPHVHREGRHFASHALAPLALASQASHGHIFTPAPAREPLIAQERVDQACRPRARRTARCPGSKPSRPKRECCGRARAFQGPRPAS